MKRIFTIIAVVVVALIASGLMLAQGTADPLVGTWKLNLAKSKFSSARPAPKSQTLKYETQGDTLKVTADISNEDGTAQHQAYTAKFDGKEYPVTGDPDRDSSTMKRINAHTTEVVGKKAGKPTVTFRRVVSKDGKTLTLRETGTDGKGRKVNDVAVYEKE
jgi:hypothetical protein